MTSKCLSSSLNCLCRIDDMAKQRQLFSTHDASPRSFKSREWDSMSRWSEYISLEEFPSSTPMNGRSLGSDAPPNSGTVPKVLHMEWVVQLSKVAEGLLAKMYRLNHILDKPDLGSHTFSDAFWKAGIFPNFPRICMLVSKKFPEHPNKLQLERVSLCWSHFLTRPFVLFFLVGYRLTSVSCCRLINLQWIL